MGKFRDLLIKVKLVYLEITKDQRDAKNKLKALKSICKKLDYIYEELKTVSKYLDNIYFYLPNEVRQSIIQSTLDFIKMGRGFQKVECDNNSFKIIPTKHYNCYSYTQAIKLLNKDLKLILNLMKISYKHGNYSDMCTQYNTANDYITKFKKNFEIQNNDEFCLENEYIQNK